MGVAALLCSTVAWASLPAASGALRDGERQWQALGLEPLSDGGGTGLRMAPQASVAAVEFVPDRNTPFAVAKPAEKAEPPRDPGPVRIIGRAGDGLYFSLRSAGATPDVAAQYLAALANEIDVGADISPGDRFDLVLSGGTAPKVLYAGLERGFGGPLKLVRWGSQWIDAAEEQNPEPVESAMILPAAGRITSYFGNRVHPILRFARFHAGIDIGAGWGSPIVAAADGQVIGAGWAGGYGRQVRIAHGDGMVSSYSHMSDYAVAPGTYVRRGAVIGYVGSSGLSTGPHLHFEVRQGGNAVNPLGVRLLSAPRIDPRLAGQVRARLAQLLKVGTKRA
jgi:murein DD-endopeptidase MepM/ murein hydrolase activator NlpD